MALRLRVTYTDGRVEEVIASPLAQVETEEKFNGIDSNKRLRASYYMAHRAMFHAGKDASSYEEFLSAIVSADEVDDDPVAAQADLDPTPAEAPTTTSPE